MHTIDSLLAWTEWATGAVLEHCRALPAESLDAEYDIGHRTIRATISHMSDALEFWTGTIGGIDIADPATAASLDDLLARRARRWSAFADLARGRIAAGHLDDTFLHDGNPTTFGTALAHVTLHDALHRSELLHILQRLGVDGLWDYDLVEWEWNSH